MWQNWALSSHTREGSPGHNGQLGHASPAPSPQYVFSNNTLHTFIFTIQPLILPPISLSSLCKQSLLFWKILLFAPLSHPIPFASKSFSFLFLSWHMCVILSVLYLPPPPSPHSVRCLSVFSCWDSWYDCTK